MVDLTVVILTKNEEKNIRKCIESFNGIMKRVVIIDSFSTDGTQRLCVQLRNELAERGCQLDFYEHEFVDQATQFNWGLKNTNIETEWCMRIDADEEITKELSLEIDEKLNAIHKPVNGIILRRRVMFMGRWIKHGGRYPEYLLRIFRTGLAKCEQKIMDEHIILEEGETTNFLYDLIDNNQKDLEWWTAKHNWYSNREVLDYQTNLMKSKDEMLKKEGKSTKQARAKRVIKNTGYYKLPKFWRAHIYFIYRYYIKLGFLDGPEGKIYHFLQAYWYRFLVDAKMYECEKNGDQMKEQGALNV